MVKSESTRQFYQTIITAKEGTVTADVAKAMGGSGEYMGPHDLVCAGYAACLNMTTRSILEKMGLPFEKVIVHIDMDKKEEGKTKFLYKVEIVGDLDEKTKKEVIAKAELCPVRKTLSQEISFETME